MIKRLFSLITAVLLISILVSCSSRKFDIYVESPLEFYTPVISSVPGFPIRVILPEETYYGEYKFKWKTDSGKFLDWRNDGKVTSLGRQALVNGNEIFWTPLEGSDEMSKTATLEIQMVRIDGGGIDSKLKFEIVLQDDGLYVINKGD